MLTALAPPLSAATPASRRSQSSAVGFTGVYKLQNVDSGKYMTFYRDDDTDTTNFMARPSLCGGRSFVAQTPETDIC